MPGSEQPIIIIRRKKKKGGEGHHGGAWKVAYADFVTAMMAFFLLLWLLNVTTDEQRRGIADFFTPASIARSESGAGGTMGGRTITAPGAMVSESSPADALKVMVPTEGQGKEGEQDTPGQSELNEWERSGPADGKLDKAKMTEAEKAAAAKLEEEENASFKRATEELQRALQENQVLQGLADRLLIEQTPEGLRIQIVDKDNASMFASGSSSLYEKSRDLLALVGQVIGKLPNRITIAGHTDGAAFAVGSRRDNWSLSTERANVCRQVLTESGVDEQRLARVIGMADREPLDADPKAARNRRISITLLRQPVSAEMLREAKESGAVKEQPKPSAPTPKPTEPILPSVLPENFPLQR
jgi:chemotaxis protein MotB